MPVLAVDYDEFVRLIGRGIPREELIDRVPMMGGAFEGEKDGKLLFEFFPNRPDLLSVEGLARACRAFFGVEPGLKTYAVVAGRDTVRIDPSVARVRPHIGFARVTGLAMTATYLEELIELQERLTTGPGRRRKKVAVGIHDAAPVRGPFTYCAVKTDQHAFVPLAMDEELTPAQILERHEKGRLFRHLVDEAPRVPLIVDAEERVLSMPPIINGQLTALTTKTRDVLVDVTGTDGRATMGILNILVTSLAERGGRIESLELASGRGGATRRRTPDLAPHERSLPYARIRQLLGLRPTPDEVAAYLGRMGHAVEPRSPSAALVRSPPWRLDLLHVDDLVEDVGIGYGFERFKPRLPQVARFGGVHEVAKKGRRARTLLLGLGFMEVVTLTVTSRTDSVDLVGGGTGALVEIANPVSTAQTILRPHLYASLLALLRANKHRELPQSIFEVGFVVGADSTKALHAAALRLAPKATFSECKGIVEAFLRDAGQPASIVAADIPGFIAGRCARLVHEGRDVGFFGELHPETLVGFELGAPAYGFEVAL